MARAPSRNSRRSRLLKKRAAKPTSRRPSRTKATARAPVVIVGFGRVGGALALALRMAHWPVSVLPRSGDAVRRAAAMKIPLADHESMKAAGFCVLAVPDAAIPSVAELVEDDLGPNTTLIHCSGALPLTTFGPAPSRSGRAVGSFHPLTAISDPHMALAGCSVAIACTDHEKLEELRQLAAAIQLSPIEVPETGRAAYHAGAVMSAGLVVALADAAAAALEHAGLQHDEAIRALLPLMHSALYGIEHFGVEKGLTGPIVRGDVAVVQTHLDALPAELGSIYRLLSRRALKLTGHLPAETRLALERILA